MLVFQHSLPAAATRLSILGIGLMFASHLRAQTPAFDVASLKASPPALGDYRANLGSALHGEVTLTNATFSECLRFAFNISNDDQIAGPDWIKSRQVRFDIAAKAPSDTPLAQLRLMLQTLLIQRFKLLFHREQKDFSYLALVIGKKGPTLRPATGDPGPSGNGGIMGRINSDHLPMSELAQLLSRFLRQPVLDMTGLTGSFEVKLQWTPENMAASMPDAVEPTGLAAAPSIFVAIQEQLGLALERRKGALEVIVVDHAEKQPLGN